MFALSVAIEQPTVFPLSIEVPFLSAHVFVPAVNEDASYHHFGDATPG